MAHRKQKPTPVQGETMKARPGVSKPGLDTSPKVGRAHRVGPREPIKAAIAQKMGTGVMQAAGGVTGPNANPVPLKRAEKRGKMNVNARALMKDGNSVFDMAQGKFDKATARLMQNKRDYGGMKPF